MANSSHRGLGNQAYQSKHIHDNGTSTVNKFLQVAMATPKHEEVVLAAAVTITAILFRSFRKGETLLLP